MRLQDIQTRIGNVQAKCPHSLKTQYTRTEDSEAYEKCKICGLIIP